jgi:hypothetical protein
MYFCNSGSLSNSQRFQSISGLYCLSVHQRSQDISGLYQCQSVLSEHQRFVLPQRPQRFQSISGLYFQRPSALSVHQRFVFLSVLIALSVHHGLYYLSVLSAFSPSAVCISQRPQRFQSISGLYFVLSSALSVHQRFVFQRSSAPVHQRFAFQRPQHFQSISGLYFSAFSVRGHQRFVLLSVLKALSGHQRFVLRKLYKETYLRFWLLRSWTVEGDINAYLSE